MIEFDARRALLVRGDIFAPFHVTSDAPLARGAGGWRSAAGRSRPGGETCCGDGGAVETAALLTITSRKATWRASRS